MYKRNAQGWSKHFDFILADEISLQIAFILAGLIRLHSLTYTSPLYRSLAFVLALVDALVLVLHNSMHNVMSRGYYVELAETVKHCFLVFAFATVFLFAAQAGVAYSRILLFLTFLLHIVIGYVTRILWKNFVRTRGRETEKKNSMLVVTVPDTAEEILTRLAEDSVSDYTITGVGGCCLRRRTALGRTDREADGRLCPHGGSNPLPRAEYEPRRSKALL